MKPLVLTFLFGVLLAAPGARADEPVASTVKFSQPDKPETVRIFVAQGTVKVRAVDSADTVTVMTEAEPEEKHEKRADGLRVISSASSFALTEKNNVVELDYGREGPPSGSSGDFVVTVPRKAAIEISNGWSTDIEVYGVMGDIEIKNVNGEILLKDVGGGALVETMNGEIKATFVSIAADKPLSFTSMNGEIELNLPAEAKANVRFRTQNGSILTDFPDDVLKTKTEAAGPGRAPVGETARIAGEAAREASRIAAEVAHEVHEAIREAGVDTGRSMAPRAPKPPRPPSIPPMVGGKVVSGQLNGGGVDIQIATMNGDIIVRKSAK